MWYNDYFHRLFHDQRLWEAHRKVRQNRLIREAMGGDRSGHNMIAMTRKLATRIGRWLRTPAANPDQPVCTDAYPLGGTCQSA